PIDITFRVAVRAVNGIQAGTRNRLIGQPEDPRFPKLLDALRRLQQKGGIGVRVEKKGENETALLVISKLSDPESGAERQFNADTLDLEPGATHYDLAFGALSTSRPEIALLTRSILEILPYLSYEAPVR